MKKAASPWAGINLDIGNFPDDGYKQIEMCAPYATNVHFKTAVHVNKQKQPADWPRVLRILGAAGYKGYLSLEYEEEAGPGDDRAEADREDERDHSGGLRNFGHE